MSNDTRPLTALEKSHVRMVQLRLVALKWILLTFGGVFFLLGMALPAALVLDKQRVPELLGLFMIVMSLSSFAAGTFFTAFGLRQELRPRGTTTQLSGKLIEKRVYVRGSTYYRYFIDDIQIVWPPGAADIYRPMIGLYISLVVIIIDRAPRKKLQAFLTRWSPKTLKNQPSGYGVVLNYRSAINIHRALEKYGRHYLVFYQIKWALGLGLWVVLTLFIAMQPFVIVLLDYRNFLLFLLAIVGYLLASGLAFYAVIKSHQTLRKWLNIDYDDTPHEERLRG